MKYIYATRDHLQSCSLHPCSSHIQPSHQTHLHPYEYQVVHDMVGEHTLQALAVPYECAMHQDGAVDPAALLREMLQLFLPFLFGLLVQLLLVLVLVELLWLLELAMLLSIAVVVVVVVVVLLLLLLAPVDGADERPRRLPSKHRKIG